MRYKPIPDLNADFTIKFLSLIKMTDKNSCWIWQQGGTEAGYGLIRYGGEQYIATRVAWKFFYRSDPGDLQVCHNCNNPRCCNPNHLFLGTVGDNQQHAFDTGIKHSSGRRKIEEQDIPLIRARLDAGESPVRIAREYVVTNECIYAIKKRKTWEHVH